MKLHFKAAQMISKPYHASYACEIEKVLRAYADIAPQLDVLLKSPVSQLDEALQYLADMHSSLATLRVNIALDDILTAKFDDAIRDLASKILDLHANKSIGVVR